VIGYGRAGESKLVGAGGVNSRTAGYEAGKDGNTYVVTNDPNGIAPSGSTSYNVSAGGGAPIGFTSNGPIVCFGKVGNESSDPETIASSLGGNTLGDITPANRSVVLNGINSSANRLNGSNPQQLFVAVGNHMQASGVGNTLQFGSAIGVIPSIAGPLIAVVLDLIPLILIGGINDMINIVCLGSASLLGAMPW
jgi:hypothetical protein